MATSNPKESSGDKTEEQMLLEAKLKEMTTEKKAVFDATREADECLRQIRDEETRIRDRLRQIEAQEIKERQRIEMIDELNVLRRENSDLNESLRKLKGTLQRTTKYSRTQQKEKREKEDEIEKLRNIYSVWKMKFQKPKDNARMSFCLKKAHERPSCKRN